LALNLPLNGEGFRVSEHGCGDVSDENAERVAYAVDGTECDQTFSSADVGVAFNLSTHDVSEGGIVGVPEMQ
jgi:hypothetical protein